MDTTSTKTRIILAESKELFRKGVAALLRERDDLEIIEQAANGRELLEHLKHKEADIILLEANLPVMNAKAVLEIIHKRFPDVRVIILSEHSNAHIQSDFLACGANGFLGKDCSIKNLYHAIHKVKTEGFFFDSATSKALLNSVLKDRQRSELSNEVIFNTRETEIIRNICDGFTNKEIALNLNLSMSTIDFYRTKIYSKSNCNNVTSLLKFALKTGLIELT